MGKTLTLLPLIAFDKYGKVYTYEIEQVAEQITSDVNKCKRGRPSKQIANLQKNVN